MSKLRHMLTLTFVLLLTAAVQPQTVAQGSVPHPVISLRPIFETAHPRAGIVNVFSGGAENFLRVPVEVSEPIVHVPAGQTFRLTAPYETVMHSLTAGFARFRAEAYLVDEDGPPQLLAEDKATIVNFGPRIYNGALNLDLKFDDPGRYRVLLHTITQVKPVGVNDVTTDEDEMTVIIEVIGPEANLPGVQPPMLLSGPGLGVEPEQSFDRPFDKLRRDLRTQLQPSPVQPVSTRTVQVATPRGEIVDGRNAAVNNFEQPSQSVVILRQGDSLRFVAGPHEFVWFEGAAGSAEASLEILDAVTDADPPISFGRDSVEYPNVDGPARRRDSLAVEVTFDDAGRYDLIARVRSVMHHSPATDVRGVVDEDDIHVRVVVVEIPETGTIKGVVTAADTLLPLPGVVVRAFAGYDGRPVATTRTREDGAYQFDALKPGRYLVQADPDRWNYLAEWYDDKPHKDQADPVEVEAGQTTDGIDFVLTPGASITGLVTEDPDPTGSTAPRPLGGILIQVGVFDPTGAGNVIAGQTYTLRDGRYAVDHLPAGTYWVRASDPHGLYKTEYWENAENLVDATPIELATGQLVEHIDFGLALAAGGISGRVVRQGNVTDPALIVPLPGILVTALNADTGDRVGKAETGPGGHYRMGGLPAGQYLVHAEDPNGRFRDEWYDEKRTQDKADRVAVENGRVTRGINFTLEPAVHTPTVLRIHPPTSSVRQGGDTFDVSLMIDHVEDLGNFELTLTYAPDVVHVESAELGLFLQNPNQVGRRYELLDPIIDNEAGEARFGVFSVGTAPGVFGSGEVLRISLVAQGPGETVLHQQNVQVLDTTPEPIPTRTEDGLVHVGECMAYDFDCDCDVDIVDVSKVARRWGTEEGDPEYDPQFDLDGDGDIDIMDVAIIAGVWGATCEDSTGGAVVAPGRRSSPMAIQSRGVGLLGTTVRVGAPAGSKRIGETAAVAVSVAEAVDLKSFEFTLTYTPTILQVESVELGDFMAGAFTLDPIVDPEAGTLRFGAADLGLDSGNEGDGVLATVNFRTVGVGTSPLVLTDVKLVGSFDQEQIDITTTGSALVVEGEVQRLPLIRR
ncbi:MAG: carboxypeptidase regulatory-like domain-containing protein [Anaerolineae bacterium]